MALCFVLSKVVFLILLEVCTTGGYNSINHSFPQIFPCIKMGELNLYSLGV